MASRIFQSCSIWFWIALFFFTFVIVQRSGTVLPAVGPRQHGRPLNVHERFERSEKAWEETVQLRHKLRDAWNKPETHPLFPSQRYSFDDYPYTIWDFVPAVWSCPWDIQRVGRLGDGGKWVCGMSKYEERAKQPRKDDNVTIIYSFGLNGESSFESEMMKRLPNAELFGFDYSVDDFGPQIQPNARARSHFMKVGLAGSDSPSKSPPFYSFQSLMAHHKHDYIDILKIDVEASEWVSLGAYFDYLKAQKIQTMPIGQIMIELHLGDPGEEKVDTPTILNWFERMESLGMRPTWLEINLLAGENAARYVEYVFVNAKDPRSVLLNE